MPVPPNIAILVTIFFLFQSVWRNQLQAHNSEWRTTIFHFLFMRSIWQINNDSNKPQLTSITVVYQMFAWLGIIYAVHCTLLYKYT